MTIVTQVNPAGAVTCFLAGSVHASHIPAVRRAVRVARSLAGVVHLDMSEVALIERGCLEYLMTMPDVTLVNCPSYVERWVRQTE
jgi:hypothetical protein